MVGTACVGPARAPAIASIRSPPKTSIIADPSPICSGVIEGWPRVASGDLGRSLGAIFSRLLERRDVDVAEA